MSASAAYIAHIVEQIQFNLAFLVDQQQLSQADAELIASRLPGGQGAVQQEVVAPVPAPPAPRLPNTSTGTIIRRGVPPPPPARAVPQARAVWAYNGGDADDLSFEVGDVIEIVEETNADWWTGKINGRQGLFPTNHVEKITNAVPPTPSRTISAPAQVNDEKAVLSGTMVSTRKPYKPFGAALHGTDVPPPVNGATNSVGLQEAPGQEQKKSKFGKYGNTMAHSAAGGVGFGAGAAIGGGLVRAIF
ncbi:SH3-domain-containing protein [Schizopora paradoxa]|uniref:SH3-domain-containing protein n=1 Tax=Schizopora paradoxa TaxID=27342 RepID=A0A0H2RGX4_9AGAM|nr:SH3-domain-containing protein [Schizopora paradoxa]